ncbi:YjfB family protein [Clostridium cellulovorans]|uniref:Motility protein n=1 Tax=Clostridium cellulovorans (strain ATCC 35296 / DSM 3052 / OCM 3 / 743B) TaxID=573061 RepID=D9SW74_CLOC7|nr:YjfB family protein [Clostridium cellulovorans]ADL51218.1 hypothetical protein Clocel_1465 [Clostridium cellulovorans 743B]
MDIVALSTVMKQYDLSAQVGVALTKKIMDVSETNTQELVKMMELSANPNLGSILDAKA